ncbi:MULTISPECIES: hypothetical protein [unclassified Halomonas]|uniref:hypothetical protein n=1 Tax=unclassified Halomonas TaxID=2609666 RepID=UPI002097FCBE|nr:MULTISPECIES: hypothetical protein [unclassified Halomonas]MCO7214813.1 hypothetical protein [Halomonas sp. OfavH-34-E]
MQLQRIPNGAWRLFRANPGGTRQGKAVVMQHSAIEGADHGGSVTIKLYQGEKVGDLAVIGKFLSTL